jgi:hypothetical protein
MAAPFTAAQSSDCYLRPPGIKGPLLGGDDTIGIAVGGRVLTTRKGPYQLSRQLVAAADALGGAYALSVTKKADSEKP